MTIEFPGIILNDRLFSVEDLKDYCEKIVKRKIPDWEKAIFLFMLDFLDESDYIEQNSSGTTGEPKLFKLSKRSMIESAKLTNAILGLKFADKALLCLPIDYIAGKMMIVRSFVAGLNLFWEEPSSMPTLSRFGKMNFCAMVPLQVYNSFSNYEFFRNIDNLIIGGAELRSELVAMFSEVSNNVYESYGMAETCSHIALRRLSGKKPQQFFETLPGVKVEVDNRECLIIHAPYINDAVKTNDVVELIDETHFIWKGRYDNLINSGGIKVKPEELEATISKVLDLECAILGLPDEKLGRKIVVVLETPDLISQKDIEVFLADVVPKQQIPTEVYTITNLPRNAAYKLDRNALLEYIKSK